MDKGSFRTKRIYERPEAGDGMRVLVDRMWPRGMTKEKAQLAVWMKEIAPSSELRRWYGHAPDRFPEFCLRYAAELTNGEAGIFADRLRQWAEAGPITLLYSAKDEQRNQAVVLKRFLERGSERS